MIARKKAKAAAEKAAKEAAEKGASGAATGGAVAASGGAAGGISSASTAAVVAASTAELRVRKGEGVGFDIGETVIRSLRISVLNNSCHILVSIDLPRRNADLAELDVGKNAKVEFPEGSSNIMHLRVVIEPTDGLWKGGKYEFDVNFKKSYPHEPPKVILATPCYHPGVDKDGELCISILRKGWYPVLDLNSLIYCMMQLFEEPSPMEPLDTKVAELMIRDRATFEKNVKASMRGQSIDGRTFPRFK